MVSAEKYYKKLKNDMSKDEKIRSTKRKTRVL